MNLILKTLTTTCLLGSVCSLQGALIFQDYFNYGASNSNLGNNAPWVRPTNNVLYNATSNSSFTNPGYAITGANTGTGRVVASGSSARSSQAPLTGAIDSYLSGEIWFSGLHAIGPTAAAENSTGFTLGRPDDISFTHSTFNSSTSFGIYNDGSSFVPYIATGNASDFGNTRTVGATSLSGGTTYLFVVQAITSTNTLNLWVFGEGDTIGSTVAALGSPTVTTSAALLSEISRIGISKTSAVGSAHWDALRVSNTSGNAGLQDVLAIPEPSTYAAMLGLAVLGFVVIRRRSR